MTTYAIVGAGQVGSRLAQDLTAQGHPVRLISRSGRTVEGAEAIAADAADREALRGAIGDADVIYNCVNPPYHRWSQEWPPIAENLLALAAGKVLVTLSNLYGYGVPTGPLTEQAPLGATSVKGRVRAQMWQEALAAHEAGRVRVVEVRGSDYIGEGGDQVVFGARVVPRMRKGKSVMLMGRTDQPHTWTYTADVAALLAVVGTDERAFGKAWHVPSNDPRTQAQVINDLAAVMGVSTPRIRTVGATQLRLAGLFNPTVRELVEMLYEFDRPFVMDSTAAQDTFGLKPTPWQTVIEQTASAS